LEHSDSGKTLGAGEVLTMVRAADAGDRSASEQLFATLYNELHRMASREVRRNAGLTLSPTTLLHETFLNISLRESAHFTDKPRFMAYAARAMRGLVIDYLRRGATKKRGGEFQITSAQEDLPHIGDDDAAIERLRDALDVLMTIDARLAECIDLKFFCGLSFGEIAELWQVSERTVQRDWDKARLLLNRLLNDIPTP
jgi:RNA polymerase sigma factor (TIGR02999 family)